MAPMVQPPPPVQNVVTESATTASLADTIHSLHNLIFWIALPKTDKAKNVAIAIANFRHACDLITSACSSLQVHHNLQLKLLNDITKTLDPIAAHFDIPNVAQPSQSHSYASVLTTGIKPSVKPKGYPVMVCPLTLHVLLKPCLYLQQLNPFLNLLDQPLTHLGLQPTSHSLSQTLVCSYYLSLLDTLNFPYLHFDPQPLTLTLALCS